MAPGLFDRKEAKDGHKQPSNSSGKPWNSSTNAATFLRRGTKGGASKVPTGHNQGGPLSSAAMRHQEGGADMSAVHHGDTPGAEGSFVGSEDSCCSSSSTSRYGSSGDDQAESFVHVSGVDFTTSTAPQTDLQQQQQQQQQPRGQGQAARVSSTSAAKHLDDTTPPSSAPPSRVGGHRGSGGGGSNKRAAGGISKPPVTKPPVTAQSGGSCLSCTPHHAKEDAATGSETNRWHPSKASAASGPVHVVIGATERGGDRGGRDQRRQQNQQLGQSGSSRSTAPNVGEREEDVHMLRQEAKCLRDELLEKEKRMEELQARNRTLTSERADWEDRAKEAELRSRRQPSGGRGGAAVGDDRQRPLGAAAGDETTNAGKLAKARIQLNAEVRLRQDKEAQVERLSDKVNELKRELEEMRRMDANATTTTAAMDASSEEVAALRESYQAATAKVEELSGMLDGATVENERLTTEIEESVKGCRETVRTKDEECRQLKREIQGARKVVGELDLAPRAMVEKKALGDIMNLVHGEMIRLKKEVEAARRKIRELGVVGGREGESEEQPLAEVVALMHQVHMVDKGRLEGEKAMLLNEVSVARKRARELGMISSSSSESLAEVMASVYQEIVKGKAHIEGLKREVREMEEQLSARKEAEAKLTSCLEETTSRHDVVEGERDEALRRLEDVTAYVAVLEEQLREPPKPAYMAPVYVAFNSEKQHQYEANVRALASLLSDPPVEIKDTVWDPSELRRSSSSDGNKAKVLLYVTYCPNPRLCVDAARLKTFTDIAGVTVVFIILKRGIGSQLTDIKGARDMVPWLPSTVLHYGINGEGLEDSETPAGVMNTRSSGDLGALIRTIFPPPTPPRRKVPAVTRPACLSAPLTGSSNSGSGSRTVVGAIRGRQERSQSPLREPVGGARSFVSSSSRASSMMGHRK